MVRLQKVLLALAAFSSGAWAAAPNAPTSLAVSLVSGSNTSLQLNWTNNAGVGTLTGFRIERKIGSGSFAKLLGAAATAITIRTTISGAGSTDTYRIYAYKMSGRTEEASAYSNEVTVTAPPKYSN